MRKSVPFLILGVALLALFYRLFIGEVLFWGLPTLQFYPWRWLAVEQFRDGHFPYWNPYNGAGSPLLANYQTALLYPPNWLYFVWQSPYVMNILALAHLIFTAIGMWCLTGRLKFTTLGRGVSMLSFALGGYLIGRVMSFPTANAIAWLPWLFWIGNRLWLEKQWPDVGWFALILGMQLLAGHAQTAFYSGIAFGLYVLWMARAAIPQDWRQTVKGVGQLALGSVLALGLAAWQLLVTAQFLNQSQRSGGIDFETITNISYAPLRILTLIAPHFFGTPADGSYITPGKGVYFEEVAYIGLIPFIAMVFAVWGWFKWRTQRDDNSPWDSVFAPVPFWGLLSLAGILLALGRFGPFYRFLYDSVPTFDNFREPVRWLIWPAFGLSILAGIGIENWEYSYRRRYWTRLGTAGAALMTVLCTGWALSISDPEQDDIKALAIGLATFGFWLVLAGILTLVRFLDLSPVMRQRWQVAVLVVIAADLVWTAMGLNPTIPPEFFDAHQVDTDADARIYWFEDAEETVKFETYFDLSDYRPAREHWRDLRRSELPNINILDQQDLFNHFDPLEIGHHQRFVDLIETQAENAGPLLRAAGITETRGEIHVAGWRFVEELPGSISLEPPLRVTLLPSIIWVGDDDEAVQRLTDPAWQPDQTVILNGVGNEFVDPEQGNAELEIIQESTYKRHYRIRADRPVALYMAYTHYPGWVATVNGKDTDLYRANLTFQTALLPAGTSDVIISYEASNETVGQVTSGLALILILGFIFIPFLAKHFKNA